ncbi:MAG: hypothetical protein H0U52_12330 [Chloroflexi bacterium]|nr:hypothetical protein [Chloroflexota bacterium]
MNGQSFARILLVLVLVGGAIGIGVSAYNAGVSAGVSSGLVEAGQVVVTPGGYPGAPYVGYGYGWGSGHGFSFFGFIGGLFVLLLLFGLIRAAFGGSRRGWGPGGHGGWGPGPGGWRSDAWEERVRETHDALHRNAGSRDAGSGPDEPART